MKGADTYLVPAFPILSTINQSTPAPVLYHQQPPPTMSRFTNRPMDLFYFIFFIWHIPISLCVDFQSIYPPFIMQYLASTPLPAFIEWYKVWSRDPIIIGASSGGWEWDWIRGFMWVEAGFQMPCWIIGAWGLWRGRFCVKVR
jgi:hypothetical protein